MSESQPGRLFLVVLAIVLVPFIGVVPSVAGDGQQDADAIISRLKELLAATDTKAVVAPFPDSRSRILAVDGTSDFFLYIEPVSYTHLTLPTILLV